MTASLKTSFLVALGAALALVCPVGCRNSAGSRVAEGPVAMAVDSATQVGSFRTPAGNECKLKVTVVAHTPEKYVNDTLTRQLQQLFVEEVMGLPAEVPVAKAPQEYANAAIKQNTPDKADIEEMIADTIQGGDNEELASLEARIAFEVQYNANDVLTFCREERITRNGKTASTTHRYTNIDLKAMGRMGLMSLFAHSDLEPLRQAIHDKLLDDNDASTDDELAELGFFNVATMNVTPNFYFTSSGLAWCYEPGILAVESLGEPVVALSFAEAKELSSLTDSALSRF